MAVLPPWSFPLPKLDQQAPSSHAAGPIEADAEPQNTPEPEADAQSSNVMLNHLRQVLGQAPYAVDPAPPPDFSMLERLQQTTQQHSHYVRAYDRQYAIPGQALDQARLYAEHLRNYAAAVRVPLESLTPLALENLTLSRRQLRLYYRSHSGKPRVATLTPENAKEIFTYLGIPYSPETTPDLLQNLKEVLTQMEYGVWDRALQQVLQAAPHAANLFRSLRDGSFWFDGHLIWTAADPSSTEGRGIMTSLTERLYPNLFGRLSPQNRELYRSSLQSLARDRRQQAQDSGVFLAQSLPPDRKLAEITDRHLLFTEGQTGCLIWFDRKQKALILQRELVQYLHTQKKLPLPPEISLSVKKGTVSRSLYLLTGGIPEVVDETAAFLSRLAAAGPGKRQLSVILTDRNSQALRHFLEALFDKKVYPLGSDQGASLPALLRSRPSKSMKPSGFAGPNESRATLLQEQINGTFLLFTDPRLPSPGKEGLFLDLIQGRKLTVPDTLLSGQTFHNQMHVVYITSEETLADKLVQRFHAYRLDLRPHEIPSPPEQVRSNWAEIFWLRRNLLPWGLTLLQKRVFRPSAKGHTGDTLADFLALRCKVSPELRISRQAMYDAYQKYFRASHGRDCPETAIQFGKQLRTKLPEGVAYKVARYGEGQLGLCYVGMGLVPESRAKQPEPEQTAVFPEAFLAHLRRIEESIRPLYEANNA